MSLMMTDIKHEHLSWKKEMLQKQKLHLSNVEEEPTFYLRE